MSVSSVGITTASTYAQQTAGKQEAKETSTEKKAQDTAVVYEKSSAKSRCLQSRARR